MPRAFVVDNLAVHVQVVTPTLVDEEVLPMAVPELVKAGPELVARALCLRVARANSLVVSRLDRSISPILDLREVLGPVMAGPERAVRGLKLRPEPKRGLVVPKGRKAGRSVEMVPVVGLRRMGRSFVCLIMGLRLVGMPVVGLHRMGRSIVFLIMAPRLIGQALGQALEEVHVERD